jgi:predicted porin
MKKSKLTFAVMALVSSTAMAQSSVTVYGKVDLGLVVDGGNPGGKSVRLASGVTGGSRLGFKGTEDLGGGYVASFQIETGFCADSAAGAPNFCTGSNNFMGRQAHGDLSTPFGTLTAGRVYGTTFLFIAAVDPFGSGLAGQATNVDGKGGFMIEMPAPRLNNAVVYTTPSFGGLVVNGEMSLGEQTGDWQKSRELATTASYTKGPLLAGVSYFTLKSASGRNTDKDGVTGGITYDFGVVKLHGMVQKVGGHPAAGKIDLLNMMAGASVPVAGGTLLASYLRRDDRTSNDRDVSQWGAGYVYAVSKRTSLYTAYAKIRNTHGATFFDGNATEQGVGNSAFNLGIAHNF